MHEEGTTVETIGQQAARLQGEWDTNPRWNDTKRTYSAEDVVRLRGSVTEEFTLARLGAERLRKLLAEEDAVTALGALTGNQAVQQVNAGLQAIYLSGWQVAADANLAGQTYPDQSLYPVNSVPQVVRRINNALLRADQITWSESENGDTEGSPYWLAPIVADAEAGFGGVLNAFELMKAMIAAGAAGVHWEDQLASEKKCGHLGGKVLIPTSQHIKTLNAARLAADVCDVPTLIIARTDAQAAALLTADVDERDQPFVTGERTAGGFYRVRNGIEPCIARGLAYAPHSDLLWMETSKPDLDVAREFAEGIKSVYPDQMLAFNCSPSFNWRAHLDEETIAKFGKELAAMGYRFQFITLAGFHALNHSMFDLAKGFAAEGMPAYVRLQQAEFAAEKSGYTATRHQREVGTGYFDRVTSAISPTRRPWPCPARPKPSSSTPNPPPPRPARTEPVGNGGSAVLGGTPGRLRRAGGARAVRVRLPLRPGLGPVGEQAAVGVHGLGGLQVGEARRAVRVRRGLGQRGPAPPPGRDEQRDDHRHARQGQHPVEEHGLETRAVGPRLQRDVLDRVPHAEQVQAGPGEQREARQPGRERGDPRHRHQHPGEQATPSRAPKPSRMAWLCRSEPPPPGSRPSPAGPMSSFRYPQEAAKNTAAAMTMASTTPVRWRISSPQQRTLQWWSTDRKLTAGHAGRHGCAQAAFSACHLSERRPTRSRFTGSRSA